MNMDEQRGRVCSSDARPGLGGRFLPPTVGQVTTRDYCTRHPAAVVVNDTYRRHCIGAAGNALYGNRSGKITTPRLPIAAGPRYYYAIHDH